MRCRGRGAGVREVRGGEIWQIDMFGEVTGGRVWCGGRLGAFRQGTMQCRAGAGE